jgi:DNA primase catalytic core
MRLPERFLEDLRARVSITQVIGRRVRLTRKGRAESSGLCPFHNEKTPSFTVNEDKGFGHCFGCGWHGDVIAFVQQTEGMEFRAAAEKLAAEAGLQVPVSSPAEREREARAATLHDVLERAARWFEGQLASQVGAAGTQAARDYLKMRGLSSETIGRFRLGFAPDGKSLLRDALEKAGIQRELAIEAGLLIKGDGSSYDRFRNRVMFPIEDARGRVIAFGGRVLGNGEPKYLNSPETPVFHKGRHLYNLAKARDWLARALPPTNPAHARAMEPDTIIVVEGYMDVIGLAQAGIGNAVAPLGTALTEDQMRLLWKSAAEPILAFDGDRAGRAAASRAALRALPILEPGRSLRFAWMPEGQDPDDLVRAGGPDAARAVFAAAEPLSKVLWRNLTEGRAFDTPERRAGLKRDVAMLAQQIANAEVRAAYQEMLGAEAAALTRVPARPVIQGEVQNAEPPPPDVALEDDSWRHEDAAPVSWEQKVWHRAAPLGAAEVAAWMECFGIDVDALETLPEGLRFGAAPQVLLAACADAYGAIGGCWECRLGAGGAIEAVTFRGRRNGGAVQLAPARDDAALFVGADLVGMLRVLAAMARHRRPCGVWAAMELSYLAGAPAEDGWKRAPFHPTLLGPPKEPGGPRKRKRLPSAEPDMARPGVVLPRDARDVVLVATAGGHADGLARQQLLQRAVTRWQREGRRVRVAGYEGLAPAVALGVTA